MRILLRRVAAAATLIAALGALSGPAVAVAALASPAGTAAVAHEPAAVALRSSAVRYASPIQPIRVVNPFQAPPTPYSAGHRGVDLATRPGTVVSAAAAGRVSFAGFVADRGVVVIEHADGVSTEYEPLTPLVHAGQTVTRGAPIGQVSGTHPSCSPGRCLHWGARRDGTYFDPLSLLAPLGPVRLLPWASAGR